MNDKKLKQILIAHPVEFTSKTVQEFAKKEGVDVYILDDIKQFRYLVEDLKPQAILVHKELLDKDFEAYKEQTLGLDYCQTIVITGQEQNKYLEKYPLQILDPFEPFKICQRIEEILLSSV